MESNRIDARSTRYAQLLGSTVRTQVIVVSVWGGLVVCVVRNKLRLRWS